MRVFIQLIRSVIFIIMMYVIMIVWGLLMAFPALLSRHIAYFVIHVYCKVVLWLLAVICNTKVEVRGIIPTGNVVIASNHQSFLDILLHMHFLDKSTFIMKQELRYVPIFGFYAMRIGSAPVKRGQKNKAISQMIKGAEKITDEGQLIIYPEGTRVPPGVYKPYKIGAAILCQRFQRPCIMAATNAGVFWPKHSLMRKQGTVVIEYLHQVPDNLEPNEFINYIETHIIKAAKNLMQEAGYKKE